jgi:hypothetical protein
MRTRTVAAARAVAAALLCILGTAGAAPEPVGDTVKLSRTDDGGQGMPQVQRRPDGRYVAVWHSWSDDDPPEEILGRVLNPDGTPAGDRFAVNQQSAGVQLWPDVAVDRYGNATVVWLSIDGPGQKELGLFARRMKPDGTPLGDEFQVNPEPPSSLPPNTDFVPHIAMAPDGRFVVAWWRQPGGTLARLYDARGEPRGEPFVVDAAGAYASVAMRDDGSFVVAYPTGDSAPAVYVRGYDADGAVAFGKTFVGTGNLGAVGAQADGGFQVAWFGNAGAGTVLLRRFSPAGVGAEPNVVAMAESISGLGFAVEPSGAAALAWVADQEVLLARAYDAAGVADGDAFEVARDLTSGIRQRGIAWGAPGFFLVAWDAHDADYGVYGRVYGPPSAQPQAPTPLPESPAPPPLEPRGEFAGKTRLGGALAPLLMSGLVLGAALRRRKR